MVLNAWFGFSIKVSLFPSCCWALLPFRSKVNAWRRCHEMWHHAPSDFFCAVDVVNHSLSVFSYVFGCQILYHQHCYVGFFTIKQTKATLGSLEFYPEEFDNCTQGILFMFIGVYIFNVSDSINYASIILIQSVL